MGKEGEGLGDLLDDDFRADLTEVERNDFFAVPRGPDGRHATGHGDHAHRLRSGPLPEQRHARLCRHAGARNPCTRSVAAGWAAESRSIFAYSDGFGRVIQQKVQAEPGPVPQRDATGQVIVDADRQPVMTDDDVDPRWVGSGWTVFNNKGKPVRQYEPFFTDRHDFEFDVRIGVSPVLCYDPVGRVVATLHPNHTYEKVVFDPWQQATWDVNDTVTTDPTTDPDVGGFFTRLPECRLSSHLVSATGTPARPERRRSESGLQADKAAVHADTPTTSLLRHVGPAGGERGPQRFERDGAFRWRSITPPAPSWTSRAQPLRIIDARGNAVMTYMVQDASGHMTTGYDLAGRLLYQNSMDAGERWMLANAAGNPIRRWDSRGFTRRLAYDELQRPTHLWVQEGTDPAWLAERTVYGERHPEAQALKLCTKPFQQYDGAGVVTSEAYDFKGNLLRGRRRLANNYRTAVDWSAVEPCLQPSPGETLNLDAIEGAVAPLLELRSSSRARSTTRSTGPSSRSRPTTSPRTPTLCCPT